MAGGFSRGNGGRRPRAIAEINITPLVDVMLVLLIIMMLVAPMLQQGIPLDLPAAETAQDIKDTRTVVSIDRDGRLRLNDQPVHPKLLEDRMRAIATSGSSETVFLRADKLVPYGEVLLVMDRIRKAGVTHVALVTVPLQQLGEAPR
jgi:biopolymer transport protein TolR